MVRYHEDDSHNTPSEVTFSLPAGWQVTGMRITDSNGMDRKAEASASIVMESNALALIEIEPTNNNQQ